MFNHRNNNFAKQSFVVADIGHLLANFSHKIIPIDLSAVVF